MTFSATDYGRFWFDTHKLMALMERSLERRFRDELGISLTQYMILSVVQLYPGSFNQQRVADYLGTTSATVSRQLETGMKAGYLTVAASAASRRENVVELTDDGNQLVEKGDTLLLAGTEQLLGRVSADDLIGAARAVKAMLAAIPGADHPMGAGEGRESP